MQSAANRNKQVTIRGLMGEFLDSLETIGEDGVHDFGTVIRRYLRNMVKKVVSRCDDISNLSFPARDENTVLKPLEDFTERWHGYLEKLADETDATSLTEADLVKRTPMAEFNEIVAEIRNRAQAASTGKLDEYMDSKS